MSTTEAHRFVRAASERRKDETEAKPWEVTMVARRRDVPKESAPNTSTLREEGKSQTCQTGRALCTRASTSEH